MKDLYYISAGVLFVIWFLGYLIFNLDGYIHLVFILAVFIAILKMYKDSKSS